LRTIFAVLPTLAFLLLALIGAAALAQSTKLTPAMNSAAAGRRSYSRLHALSGGLRRRALDLVQQSRVRQFDLGAQDRALSIDRKCNAIASARRSIQSRAVTPTIDRC